MVMERKLIKMVQLMSENSRMGNIMVKEHTYYFHRKPDSNM